jgi:hypothetical protein
VLGFGARLPPDGVVSHEFSLVCRKQLITRRKIKLTKNSQEI